MGFGVLEDSHMAAPPGTATINTLEVASKAAKSEDKLHLLTTT